VAERPILLRFLNVLTSLNGFIIKRIVFLFLVSGTLICMANFIIICNSSLYTHIPKHIEKKW
jgi:hypothetical protein